MFTPLNIFLGCLAAIVLAVLFVRRTRQQAQRRLASADTLFADVEPLLGNPTRVQGESFGSWKLTGSYQGQTFQFTTLVDTLAVRKLPSLWLLVTLPKPQRFSSTIDMMMRPAGPTTFSNFDFLPHTLMLPPGFPADAVIRSDQAKASLPLSAMSAALDLFHSGRGKELLLSPKGLRLVLQVAEADRARYGVLREARFESARIEPALAAHVMNTLLQLDNDLAKPHD